MRWNPLRFARKSVRTKPVPKTRLAVEELESRLLLTNVLTYHNDLASTGQNLNETALTTSNVNASSFGKVFTSSTVDGQIYAQPLVVTGVQNIDGGTHDVVYVATEGDSIYAFDANTGSLLWHNSYLQPGERTLTTNDVSSANIISPQIGITGTPVIDASTGTMYFVTTSTTAASGTNASSSNTFQRLHAIDISTGNEKFGGPVDIQASVNGTGTGNDGNGHVPFDSLIQLQRSALTLANGVVYIAWASYNDLGPYHGWIMGYNSSTLQQVAVFNDTPNGAQGGIWESGAAITVDAQGNLYLETGNGTFDGQNGTSGNTGPAPGPVTGLDSNGFPISGDYGDSFVKLTVDPNSTPTTQNENGWGLKVADYFTPFNQQYLDDYDLDLGSAPVLLPDSAGNSTHPHLMIGAGKDGTIYLIDRDNMGKFGLSDDVVQEQQSLVSAFGSAAYFNGSIYFATIGGIGTDHAKAFSISNGTMSSSPTSESPDSLTGGTWRGSTPSISANGSSNGILWTLDGSSNQLRAYDATNLGNELYTSAQAANNRDQIGTVDKFTVPTVANGHVYVGTANALVGYGLLAKQLVSIAVTPVGPSATAGNSQQFIATGTYTDQSTADITNQVTWASSNAGVATISNASGSQGLAAAQSPGTTAITATLGGVASAPDTLTVTAAPTSGLAGWPVE